MAHGEATCWRVMVPDSPRVGQAVDLGGGFGVDGENQGHDINVDESNEEVIILDNECRRTLYLLCCAVSMFGHIPEIASPKDEAGVDWIEFYAGEQYPTKRAGDCEQLLVFML